MNGLQTICPGCGIVLPVVSDNQDLVYNRSAECQAMYDVLSLYTLSHDDEVFIHQYVVDAYTAQHAGHLSKPIATVFALVGLYLHIEKNYSGKEVQHAHMKLAEKKKVWPEFAIPIYKGNITVLHVMDAEAGPARDAEISKWSLSVWQAWSESRDAVAELVARELKI